MHHGSKSTKNRRIIISGALVLAAAVALVFWVWSREAENREFTLDDGTKVVLKAPPAELRQRAHEGRMKQVADFFALAEKDRTAYLDKVIDEQQAAMERLGIDPANLTHEGGAIRMGAPTTRPGGAEGNRMVLGNAARSLTQDLSAEDQARMAEFTKAMMDRRKARGIEGPMVVIHTPSN